MRKPGTSGPEPTGRRTPERSRHAKQKTIFQEFTRLEPEAQHGAGVGLAISRRIARLLGGDITIDSDVGRGSTFTLWLPLSGIGNRESGTRSVSRDAAM